MFNQSIACIYSILQLLGCPEEVLEKALTSRTLETRGEKVLENTVLYKNKLNSADLCILQFVVPN